MKVFTRDYRITGEYHPLWSGYFGGMKPCVLDIEATGLDRSRCRVVLIGVLMPSDKGVTITQFLAENHYEEAKVLDAAMDFIEEKGAGYIISFNGHAYDIPFINARLERCGLGRHLRMYHFDLFRFLIKATDMRRRLPSMSQMAIEDHYGILKDRGDTITGRESVALFDQYALSGNSTLEKIILTHNREDVLHLHRLMYAALAEVPDMHQALAIYGFPAAGGRLSVRPAIRPLRSGSAVLRITGEQILSPVSMAYFPDTRSPLTVTFSASSSSYGIECPVSRRGDDFYMDVSFLFDDAGGPAIPKESLALLESDPDCINGYLILGSRTINLISKITAGRYAETAGIQHP